MKLDQIALFIVVAFAVLWAGTAIVGLSLAAPWGFVVLIPIAVFSGLIVAVIVQRLNNKEDDYYEKNIDK